MFSKKRRREPAIGTLVGAATRVNGDLEFSGGCLIDGYVMGNVSSAGDEHGTLSVSERGCVEGTIEVPNVLLNGTVKGDVKAVQRVELGAGAKVLGNVEYGLIEMAIGAQVNGKLLHKSENGLSDTEPGQDEGSMQKPGPEQDLTDVGRVKAVGEST
jgi:cytoskeletal protein CcmA (bactofilin family)